MQYPAVGPLCFAQLPLREGEDGAEIELMDGARLTDHGNEYQVRTKADRVYHFRKSLGSTRPDGVYEIPLARISDLCGNWLEFERRDRRAIAIAESAGRRVHLRLDRGRIVDISLTVLVTDAAHRFMSYEYDADGDLTAVIDALGNPYAFEYVEHHLVRHTDRNGLSFYYEYDKTDASAWRVVRSWGDGNLYNYRFEYIDSLNERRITDSLGHASVVTLDARGLPVSELDPLGGRTVYAYDEAGRTTAVVDQDGRRTGYAYDDRGNLTTLTRPDGAAFRSEFDDDNRVISVTHPGGARWLHEWDERHLLIAQTGPSGHTSHYEHDGWGQLIACTNPRGARTEFGYDQFGNIREVANALGGRTALVHDVRGNLLDRVDPLGRATSYRYDAKSHLIGVTLPSGARIVCDYDAGDGLVRYVDEHAFATSFEYSGQGEISRRIHADGRDVHYDYDTEERLVAVTNERGETYELYRDALGRVVQEVDYWGQSREYSYSSAGALAQRIDPLGDVTDLTTDALGRITAQALSNPQSGQVPWEETFSYDASGNIVACANADIRIERRFDVEGRMLEERQGDAVVVRYSYDEVGNRTATTTEVQSGSVARTRSVRCTFDLLDQVAAVTDDAAQAVHFERDAGGRMIAAQLGQTLRREFDYAAFDLPVHQRTTSNGSVLSDVAYDYDVGGRLVRRTGPLGSDRLSYDPVGHVIAHADPLGRIEQYVLDPAGDPMPTAIVLPTAPSPAPDSPDVADVGSEPIVVDPAAMTDRWRREGELHGVRYAFDRAGRLVERTDSTGPLVLAWDANQRLVESRARGAVTRYRYDPLGRRVGKSTDGRSTAFVWDGNRIVGELQVTGEPDQPESRRVLREWLCLPGSFEPLIMIPEADTGPAILYYEYEPNGCPTRLVDGRGDVKWAAPFDPWGDVRDLACADVDNPIRLQGQYEDHETGLRYNRYRYFSSELGQFIAQDPLRLGAGPHLYAYGPNAIIWTDPLGLTCVYRFHTASNAASLLPNLAHASWARQKWVNFLMNFPWYRDYRAHLHMRGDTRFSPFVSVITDPNALAHSTDPWARTITTGLPGMPGVQRAPDLSSFDVPPNRLIGPRADNVLSQAETEMVTWGNDLGSFITGTHPNPY
jgi:RHS repeat-associated protein